MLAFESKMKYWRVVLRDIFLIPDAYLEINGIAPPIDIADIVRLSGLTAEAVQDRLSRLQVNLDPEVCVSEVVMEKYRRLCEVSGREFFLLDVRCSDEFSTGSRPGAVSIHKIDFTVWLKRFTDSKNNMPGMVIVLGSDDEQSWSAAMYLRDHGIREAYALELTS